MRNKTRTHDKDTYLGDGLYARESGGMIILEAPREDGEHWVALEPGVFETLLKYAQTIGWLDSWEWKR